jgi:hypothetical protein
MWARLQNKSRQLTSGVRRFDEDPTAEKDECDKAEREMCYERYGDLMEANVSHILKFCNGFR